MIATGLIRGRLRAAGTGIAVFALAMLSFSPVLRADDETAGAPARAVRLSSVDGRVQIAQDGQVIADPAVINAPLFEGTQVITFDDGKAEVQFEEGSVARISPNSSLTLTVLRQDDGVGGTEARMDRGLGYFELQAGAQAGHIQVRFGDSVVTSSGFTVLRIDMDNAPGELAVFSGNAHLERENAVSVDLHGGESIALGAQDPTKYSVTETIEPDSWDTWNADRDQALNAEASSRTEATESFADNSNPAWSDLDANGNWYNVPGSGYVWSPYDAANPEWDPYGNGYWMWTPRFGYVWASGDSWGYLPFSCGMWSFYTGFGWGWSPGMGACTPWWGSGGIWVVNIVRPPFGYLPPRRPHRPVNRFPGKPGGRAGPYPLIAVNKRMPSGFGGAAPRNRNVSATIGGHVVMPVRTVAPRPIYDRPVTVLGNRPVAPGSLGNRPSNGPVIAPGQTFGGARPPSITPARPITDGGQTMPPPSHVTPPSPSHISPPPPSHISSPPPVSHAPAGGGAPHGGGGGGGGAPHGGGGGGASPHH